MKITRFAIKEKLYLHRIPLISVFALLLAFLISTFVCSLAFIYGDSMSPTYNDNDTVLLDRTAAAKKNLQNGDVIIFKNPNISKHPIVKRIIALPGQTVEIIDGQLLVNGTVQDNMGNKLDKNENMEKITVEENCFFVMGDNFSCSVDSRNANFGTIPRQLVIGKVICRIFPF